MPALVISGSPIAVERDVSHAVTEIGERARAWDGTMRTAVRARKNAWGFKTPPLSRSDADAFVATLTGTPPLTCSGDVLGTTVSCIPEYQGMEPVKRIGELRFRVKFTLHEV